MTEQIWYEHSVTGAVVEQPAMAQPFLAQSGWFPLSDEEAAAREQAAADAVAADEQAMTDQARAASADTSASPTGVPDVSTTPAVDEGQVTNEGND